MIAMGSPEPSQTLDLRGYQLEREDDFSAPELDRSLWRPWYLPQWSSRMAAAARYSVGDGTLRLQIEVDQPPWCPEFDGWLRVSSVQTGVFAGPPGRTIGQHHFRDGLVVREGQPNVALYTPLYGLFELRARALDDPDDMVALWMIGYEDEPDRSAEICIFEIFGRDVGEDSVKVGMGIHPFGDPTLTDEFSAESVAIDAREVHAYAAEWTPEYVAFYIDNQLVKVVRQSPAYPMQFMLNVYEFAKGPELPSAPDRYPKVFEVQSFRGYRRR
jgi:Glycosyl hydrolases family 16